MAVSEKSVSQVEKSAKPEMAVSEKSVSQVEKSAKPEMAASEKSVSQVEKSANQKMAQTPPMTPLQSRSERKTRWKVFRPNGRVVLEHRRVSR
jgi:hypothetical protein